ncbi:MAG: Lrp/AsnC family transcriptional regulator [Tissierellaceae bacterium]
MILDEIDYNILESLSDNARMAMSDISKKVNLSVPAVSERIKKLEKSGFIQKYTTVLDAKRFNKNLVCYTYLSLKYSEGGVERFKKFIQSEADILECSLVTGEYEYILKIITDSSESLAKLLDKLRRESDVLTSSTSISLLTLKDLISYQPKY